MVVVEVGVGLVEHEQLRITGERRGDRDAAALPARQPSAALGRDVGQPDGADRPPDGAPAGAGRTLPPRA